MILAALSLLLRRSPVPIEAEHVETLDRDGARALNWAMARGSRRLRRRLAWHLVLAAMVAAGAFLLHWSPAGVLAFLILNSAAGVVIDTARVGFAHRWLVHAHGREYRAEQILATATAVESGLRVRRPPGLRPQVLATYWLAAGLSVFGVPLAWFALVRLGWLNWSALFGNRFLPLLLLATSAVRLVLAIQEIRITRMVTVGSRELHIESDDALDVYALTVALALPAWLLGSRGAEMVAVLIATGSCVWWGWRWWQLRRESAVLAERVYRTHPNARPRKNARPVAAEAAEAREDW